MDKTDGDRESLHNFDTSCLERCEAGVRDTNHLNKTDAAAEMRRDANVCMGLGLGVGALGAVGAVIAGAVCPLCYFVAPGLIGAGLVQRIRAGGSKEQAPPCREE